MEPFFSEYFYLNLYKNHTYAGNCGFLKWEITKEKHKVIFCLKNLPRDYSNCMVKTDKGDLLWNFTFTQDCQAIVWQFSLENEPALAEKLQKMQELEICFETGISCKTKVSLPVDVVPVKSADSALEIKKAKQDSERDNKKEEQFIPKKEMPSWQESQTQKEPNLLQGNRENYPQTKEIEILQARHSDAESTTTSENYLEKENKSMNFENDEAYSTKNSWQNLCKLYTVVHPFRDDREFLSVTVKDFPNLGADCQKLSHNSFLLHGFYNYQHLILGKVDPDREQYYIGVPGVYQEREKKSAQMFGFVGFEGIDKEIIRGCFGYYMIEVSL